MISIKRLLTKYGWLLLLCLVLFFFREKFQTVKRRRYPARSVDGFTCPYKAIPDAVEERLRVPRNQAKRILLISKARDKSKKEILLGYLNYFKLPILTEEVEKTGNLSLELNGVPRFSVVIFSDISVINEYEVSTQVQLQETSKKLNISLIYFVSKAVNIFNLTSTPNQSLVRLKFVDPKFSNLAKVNVEIPFVKPFVPSWTTLGGNGWKRVLEGEDNNGDRRAVITYKTEPFQVVFGGSLNNWAVQLAFVDAINNILVTEDRERFIQIDIDDVFVGQIGTRIVKQDVEVLRKTQNYWRENFVDNFTFTLGFSGAFFGRGTPEEAEGDQELLNQSQHFLWFPHMWKHNHAQELSYENLTIYMNLNKEFAFSNNLNITEGYAVAPQHSGVYPIHNDLYKAWRDVWCVKVTSTEEYPHFSPPSKRRGFVYNNISVLPRQTCGLFTHTLYFHALPEGLNALRDNIEGGALFSSLLFNRFNIFMTHQQNFGNDRLAIYTFENLFKFINCWTNIKLKWVPPITAAEMYFNHSPQTKSLSYTDICNDQRHKKALSQPKSCDSNNTLPNLLILGPQKTGTTALIEFLKLHPKLKSNIQVEDSFEEAQFFGHNHYQKGYDWYRSLFPTPDNVTRVVLEKSANYFDSALAPEQVHVMLPHTKLLVILMDPADRAYSWYQHMRFHNDTVALKYSLLQIMADKSPESEKLRQRCLQPGFYANHLERWLNFFSIDQFIFIDARDLREDPVKVMNAVVKELHLPSFDYSQILKFNAQKGFFCWKFENKGKCLGAGKGRNYPPMPNELKLLLNKEFSNHSRALIQLLSHYKMKLPYYLVN